ncbi:MAG: DUF4202 domain-containing protein [Saprospiraceae bacterium]|nr:DUF4202 domain-containing protein [Saprospiraceae bacterium]
MDQNITKFQKALSRIDQKNSEDPNMETWEGKEFPKELLYAMRMSDCLDAFEPNASEALLLAARAHHIGRWKVDRSEFPEGRSGYLKWRNHLKEMHAKWTAEILMEVGYDKDFIQEVSDLILKKGLKKNEQTQILEDVICLVFLEHYLDGFTAKTSNEKIIEILSKTWRKMSSKGHKWALAINYQEPVKSLINEATTSNT